MEEKIEEEGKEDLREGSGGRGAELSPERSSEGKKSALDKALICVENQYQGSLLPRGLGEIAVSMTCGRESSGLVPQLWG